MKTWLMVVMAVVLGAPALATAYPLSVKDDLGRTVTLKAQPRRVISMLPSHTETLFAIGAGQSVVGRDDYSDYPAQAVALPKLGGLFDANLEAIVAAKPDLVLASEYGDLPKKLEALGIVVWAGSAQGFEDVFTKINVLGKLTNHEDGAANVVAQMRRDIHEVEVVTRVIKKVSVYYEIDPTPYTVGPNSFIGVLLQKAGGQNIIPANLGDFPKIAPELVVKANPQVIVGASREEIGKRAGWSEIAAVKNNRVHVLTPEQDNLISRPGPRLAQGLKLLAKLLHPDLFR